MEAVSADHEGNGYQLTGNKPKAQTSDRICISAKLINIRIFYNTRPGISNAALLGGKFDEALKDGDTKGTRPMLVADSVHRDKNGQERLGLPIAFLGVAEHNGGFMVAKSPSGGMQSLGQMADLEFTAEGRKRLSLQDRGHE